MTRNLDMSEGETKHPPFPHILLSPIDNSSFRPTEFRLSAGMTVRTIPPGFILSLIT